MLVPRDFAWITGLGEPVSVHRSRRAAAILILVVTIPSILLFGFLGGAILEDVLDLPIMRGVAVAAVFWTIGLALLGYWVGSRVGRAAVLYESGVAVRDGTSIRAWSFDQLAAVTVERVLRRTSFRVSGINVGESEREEHKYIVTDAAGGRFVLDEWLTRVEGVGTVVEEQVAARMGPRVIAAFQAGSPVSFGVVEISLSHGLRLYGRSIPWHEVNGLGVADGQLLVREVDGRRSAVPLSQVANATVLLSILGAMRQPAEPAQ